jgi:hypothetical protein
MLRRSIVLSILVGFFATILVTVGSSPASAQPRWMARDSKNTVMIEMLRPSLEGADGDALSAAYFISDRWAATPDFAVVWELPFARYENSSIGNMYMGGEHRIGSSPIFIEVGTRLNTASDHELEALATGLLSDVSRRGAFIPDILLINAAFNVYEVTPSRMAYRLRVGPEVAGPALGRSGDSEIFAHYSFQVGYQGSSARLGAGISGRALVTDDRGNLGQRTLNQLEVHTDFLSGRIRPGLDLRLPLGSLSQAVSVVLGGSITWAQ